MLDLAAGTANVTSSIPFWLQIASITAAPILGFIGVALGVALNERNRRTAYFIEEKKKAYLEFINTLAAIYTFWTDGMTEISQNPIKGIGDKIAMYSKSQGESLHRTYAQILLFGSRPVIETGNKCFDYVAAMAMTALIMLTKGVDAAQWYKEAEAVKKLITDFSVAARKDLGLPGIALSEYNVNAELDRVINKFIEDTSREDMERISQLGHHG
jgi:hypothetical protein